MESSDPENQDPADSSRSLDELFARNLPRLIAFIRARGGGVVGARESASDLAQSVCREAVQELDSFEFRGERAFVSWLYRRAEYKISNKRRWHRQAKRNAELEVAPDDEAKEVLGAYASLVTPSRVADAREELHRIEAAIDRLPDGQREAVAMTRIAGLDYAETAELLGRTESAVRGLVMRGMASLAKWLEDE